MSEQHARRLLWCLVIAASALSSMPLRAQEPDLPVAEQPAPVEELVPDSIVPEPAPPPESAEPSPPPPVEEPADSAPPVESTPPVATGKTIEAPTTPPGPWWEAAPWVRLWVLVGATGLPALLALGVPATAALVGWMIASVPIVTAISINLTDRNSLEAYSSMQAMVMALVLAGAWTGVMGVVGVVAYVMARFVTGLAAPLKGEESLGISRMTRSLVFFGVDVGVHAAVAAASLVVGAVLGATIGGGMVVASLFAPFTLCLPFGLPIPVAYQVPDTAIYGFTSIPVFIAMIAGGLCGGGIVAAQVATPLLTLLGVEWLANRQPSSSTPAPEEDEDDAFE